MTLPFAPDLYYSRLEVHEQALDETPLGLGLVMKINLLNFHIWIVTHGYSTVVIQTGHIIHTMSGYLPH